MAWNSRARFAIGYSFRHLLVSILVATMAAWLVFVVWYPAPTAQMLNVGKIYIVLLAADVVCGPLLTLVLASPAKPRHELFMDLGLIGLIQLAALGYGLSALEGARPIAYVFEIDRLVVVSKNEIFDVDCGDNCDLDHKTNGIKWRAVGSEQFEQERIRSLDLSMQGVSPAMRPSLWIDWDWRNTKLQSALQPLNTLDRNSQDLLLQSYSRDVWESSGLKYLPMVSSKTLEWIAIFDAQGKWMGAFPVDGFRRQ